MPSPAPAHSTGRPDRFSQILALTAAAAALGLLACKFLLVGKLNVNWDEFYYLSHVYAAARGELNLLLNGSYVHLFGWLTRLDADEIGQIQAARILMVALLGVTAWLVWRLARNWMSEFPALVAPFAYLSCMPVMVHGGSFRSDSLLAPLTMAALVLLTRPGRDGRQDWYGGLLLGAAFGLTIKAALFAPLVALLILCRPSAGEGATAKAGRDKAQALIRVSLAAGTAAALVIVAHWLTVSPTAPESPVAFGARTASKTLFEVPWFPRLDYLQHYLHWQPVFWMLLVVGALMALVRRRFDLAALALALLPLAVYRNAFPYYYIVMLAPAAVLVGYAIQEIVALVRPKVSAWVASALLAAIWIGLLYQGVAKVDRLFVDDQVIQQALLRGIHTIFPEPVNYVDRCGMVPSFRKVNFFMSTWGMESYRRRGEPFLPAAIRDHRPAFIIENTISLNPSLTGQWALLPEDRELIADYYPRYWGPVRVAGTSSMIDPSKPLLLRVPFPDRYRIKANGPIRIDGVLRENGEIISVPVSGVTVETLQSASQPAATSVTLFLAAAEPPPSRNLPPWPLFSGL